MTSAAHIPNRLLGVAEVCFTLGVRRTKVFELFASQALAHVKLGRRTLVRADELQRFIDSLPSAKEGAQ
jgi:excisionase family DNA binding protein